MTAAPRLARPFTPDSLAKRWDGSAEKIRKMCKAGELRSFRIGVMFRIPADAVEEYECQTSPSDDSEADSRYLGTKRESADAISLKHAQQRKPRRKPEIST